MGNEKGERTNSKILKKKKAELDKYHFRELNKDKGREREKKKTKNEEKYLRFFFLKYVGKRGK